MRNLIVPEITPRLALLMLGLAAVYFATSKLGFTVAFTAEQVTPVWPPTGIALAALLLLGGKVWPGIWLGAFATNITANEPLITALGIAAGNTLEAVCGAWLLLHFTKFDNGMDRIADVLGLLFFSALVSTMIAATIGVTSLCVGGVQPWTEYGPLWLLWWLGDAGGALIVAPVLLAWFSRPLPLPSTRKVLEALLMMAGLTIFFAVAFTDFLPVRIHGQAFVYAVFPFLIWAAMRFGQRGTALVTLAATAMAVWATTGGQGPFASSSVSQSLLLVEIFMLVVAATGLVMSAAIAERRTAEENLRRYADELQRVNQDMDDFVHIVSHDLKEPARGIHNFASFLIEDYEKILDEEGRAQLLSLKTMALRMQEMISDLLHYSRLGRAETGGQTSGMGEIIESIREMLEHLLAERNASIKILCPLPEIACDRAAVTELFRNLITNAIRYNDKPAPLVEIGFRERVQAPHGREYNVFFVRDNGIGIEPKFQAEIFRMFRRLPSSSKFDASGTGVGLAFAKKVVERCNGRIWIESEPGKGSVFYFTLGGA